MPKRKHLTYVLLWRNHIISNRQKIVVVFVTLLLISTTFSLNYAGEKSTKKRLRRSESFFGLHFDFHAGEDCKEVGKDVTPEMVKAILDAAKPDYVQCDCKGHRGFTSYPTKLGNGAPGFVKDPLRIWRDVTEEQGVALYVHYSGVLDGEAITQHPEYAVEKPDGKTGTRRGPVL